MNCIDTSTGWCTDSRDDNGQEVVSVTCNDNSDININESSNSRGRGAYDDLSNSVHQLLLDSSERQSLHTRMDSFTTPLQTPEGDSTIFRKNESIPLHEEGEEESSDNSEQCLLRSSCKLRRCTAWSQDDIYYSFDDESERFSSSPRSTQHEPQVQVRMVHWDDIVHDSIIHDTTTNANNNNNKCDDNTIFRFTTPTPTDGDLCKLDRCAAWSIDESNNSNCSIGTSGSCRLHAIQEETTTTKIHWDEIVKGSIYV